MSQRHHWSPVITSFFVLGVKVQLLTNFSIFRFGGEVNSEKLISYFMLILGTQYEFDKNKGVLCHFLLNFL